MPHFGLYEPLVKQALFNTFPAPWTVAQLHTIENSITADLCRTVYPHCHPRDVTDWLGRMSGAEQQQLIDHLNSEHTTGADSA
jgi:hypothetical protein